ncbi:hypothetical protein A8C32_03710 [Flavivirga aquatica]|uniref:SH3b domain-containing protein n=1 Tax=Flavivirga aquatica TaxID=1849968 RepID=A0A1E5TB65_9FLAO|nr:SH3 domain-containing protein [Flavivirga aquatica]OEK08567.1 hypothetical protein A8C32_03710 [Flavivirga aquatica]
MKKLILFFIIIIFSCTNKVRKNNDKIANNEIINNISENLNDTLVKKNKLDSSFSFLCENIDFDRSIEETNSIRHIMISTKDIQIKLTTFFEHEYTYLLWKDNPPIITEYRFTREIEENDIILFKCDKDYIMAMYSSSEEFNVYELIKLSHEGVAETLEIYSYDTVKEGKEFSYSLKKNKDNFTLISKGINNKLLNIYDDVYEGENMLVKEAFPITETYLNIRSAPNTQDSEIISKAYSNDKLFVLGDLGEWSIIYLNGIYGYVSNEFIKE